jgi:hypothetical protein
MRRALVSLFVIFMACMGVTAAQETAGSEACEFAIRGSEGDPVIAGPEEVVSIARVLRQPDSPIVVRSVDFEGTFLWVGDGEYSWEPRAKVLLRNQSDRVVENFEVFVFLMDEGGGGGVTKQLRGVQPEGLRPQAEVEMVLRAGRGHGGSKANGVHLMVGVEWVQLKACRYSPSMRMPSELGVVFPGR